MGPPPLMNIYDFIGEVSSELSVAPPQQVMCDARIIAKEPHDFILVQETSVIVEDSLSDASGVPPSTRQERTHWRAWLKRLAEMGLH